MVIIENSAVWNGALDDEPGERTIVIEDRTISRILAAGEAVDAPAGVRRIDASGKFILPGLINSHTHICFNRDPGALAHPDREDPARIAIKAAHAAERTLREGITTIRDLGAPAGIDIALRDMINEGLTAGPRMVVSGRCLCMTGGHGHWFGLEVDGPDEARKGARLQLKLGADMLKVMATGGVMTRGVEPGSAQLTVAEMRSVVDEAAKVGTVVAAHAHGTQGIINAVEAGVKNIEHGTLLDEKGADLMAENGAYYTPTFISAQRIFDHGMAAGIGDSVRKVKQLMEPRRRSLQLAVKTGLKILIGSDAGTPANPNGMESLLGNMLLLNKEGMDTRDILAAATGLNAQALGLGDRIGRLAPGYEADLIAVTGNPFTDLGVLGDVDWVIKAGDIICGL